MKKRGLIPKRSGRGEGSQGLACQIKVSTPHLWAHGLFLSGAAKEGTGASNYRALVFCLLGGRDSTRVQPVLVNVAFMGLPM